ncbi:MAG: energy transducer TonB [Gammaproteobacteria bacterium]|nr:energy transducer TonB [Gammaproteobacteria bacterium]
MGIKSQNFFRFLLFSTAVHALLFFTLPKGGRSADINNPPSSHLLRVNLAPSPEHITLNEALLPPTQKKWEKTPITDPQKNHKTIDNQTTKPVRGIHPRKPVLPPTKKTQPTLASSQQVKPNIILPDNHNPKNAARPAVEHQRATSAIRPPAYPSATDIQQIQKIIASKLHPHFVYPRLAQIKNWEGTVLLTLNLLGDGRINNVKLYKSSGHSILDQSALQTIKKATVFTEALKLSRGVMVELTLPIVFTLQES